MDVKLKVLGGAKAGTEIPLKTGRFVIGRASDCTLRAGSDAISRHHCAIQTERSSITIADLGSRNGTYVNDQRIESEVELKSGDEVRVGPLCFQILASRGLDSRRHPEVKDAADAANRSAKRAKDEGRFEDSISEWLTFPGSDTQASHETASLRLDETQLSAASDSVNDQTSEIETPAADSAEAPAGASQAGDTKKGKQGPGKLPLRPKSSTKDSREAAAEVLRSMTRRR